MPIWIRAYATASENEVEACDELQSQEWPGVGMRIRLPWIPLIIVAMLIVFAVFGTLIAPHPANTGSLSHRLSAPGLTGGYLLGTDALGRDILSRIIVGARVSLLVGLAAIAVGGGIGTVLGMTSGFLGGWVDMLIMRATDLTMSLPLLLIGMVLAIVRGPSFTNVVITISILLWGQYARQIRGEVLSLKEKDFVALARVGGRSNVWIMAKHVFPNVVNTLIVLATLQIGLAITVEASLSFLGAGVPPPAPSWGGMVSDGRGLIDTAWWVSFFPGLMVLMVVFSMNYLGDWLRDRLDPKLRQLWA